MLRSLATVIVRSLATVVVKVIVRLLRVIVDRKGVSITRYSDRRSDHYRFDHTITFL